MLALRVVNGTITSVVSVDNQACRACASENEVNNQNVRKVEINTPVYIFYNFRPSNSKGASITFLVQESINTLGLAIELSHRFNAIM